MNEHPFLKFIELVQFDQKIHALENAAARIEQEIADIKAQQEDLEYDVQEAHKKVLTCKKNVDAHELEMRSLDQQEKEKKQRLEKISDYKQYQSVKIEIEAVQKNQVAQEHAILNAWNLFELAQQEYAKKQQEVQEHEEKMRADLQEKVEQSAAAHKEHDELIAQRLEKEKAVPAEWLEKYGIMRSRVSDPVVPIIKNSCSACSHMITPPDMMRAKRSALIQCQSCFRLLYLPEAMGIV